MDINSITSDFQILGHSIKALELNNDFIVFDTTNENITREIDVKYAIGDHFELDDNQDSIGGTVTLYTEVKITNDDKTASIHLELEGGFALINSKDKERLDSMLAINGCAALYSISRGIIASITSQMAANGYGTILIPMINTFELKADTNDK